MSTKIEWTNVTWNPVVGCNKVSDGCKNCYAEVMHKRQRGMNPEKYSRPFLDGAFPHEASLELPLHWKKPRMVFVNSMSDLFHENVPFEFIDKVFAVMQKAEQHIFQILTKRPERALEYYQWQFHNRPDRKCLRPDNVWIGTSVENQKTADERIPYLLQIPAAVRWLSCEPLLGEVDLKNIKVNADITNYPNILNVFNGWIENNTSEGVGAISQTGKIKWVVCGGESGNGARPMHPDWARKLRDDCIAAGVPFFFKQWGEWCPSGVFKFSDRRKMKHLAVGKDGKNLIITGDNYKHISHTMHKVMVKAGKHKSGRLLDGVEWNEWPENQLKISN
jgi:protein gp37